MEVPITVSASGGTLRSLPRKLDSLLSEPRTRAEYELQQAEKDEIGHLKRDLEELISKYLIEPSEVEAPALTAERWVKEARELSYDVDDFVDELIYDGANARISFARKTSRVKIARLRKKLNPRGWITAEISGFRTRVKEMIQRHRSYHLDKCTMRKKWDEGQLPLLHGVEAAHQLVDIDGSMKKLESMLLTDDGDGDQHKPKVVSITGFGGVGKTALAKQLYSHLRERFECRAFVRSSRKPDMRRLLTNMLSQLRRHQPVDAWEVPDLINNIRTHLQDKKYFIIIDDLWTLSAWDIVSYALTESNRCSRVLITTEVDILAQACCGRNSDNIVTMKPLSDIGSTELFLSRVFGHEHECSEQLNEVSCEIIRKCGGFPLAIIAAASLLANQPVIIDKWNYVQNSFSSNLRTNPTPEGMNQVLNLSYNNLPQRLKACMLYLSIYQEDYIIWKDDLVKQWNAEGFISEVEGKDIEEVAGSYFNELINKGMIQPVDINYNGEVLSCTVHYMVLNLIRYKSKEENFITAIGHSQTAIRLADKVRRLSLHFGNEEDATPPANMRLSQVRSLAFSGLFKCMPSINEFKLLRVLILKLWVDSDDTSYNLKEISKLFRLRYLYIDACHLSLKLPAEMQQLKDLVTLEIDAKVSEVPSDIVYLHGLSHLRLPGETNLPDRIGHMTSLRTLGYYNLSSNSKDNVLNLGKLTNLWDLRLTCAVVLPDNLESNMQHLGSILGKLRNLKSLTLNTLDYAGATSLSISCDGLSSMSVPPALLERLEFSRRICTFSSLPRWIGKLNKLCILKIAVRELLWNDIDILKELPALTALSLYVPIAPSRRIFFDGAGFRLLKYFKFVCTAPCLAFVKGAIPNVRRLKLGFNANWMEQYNPEHAGFEHLTGLKEISVKIGGAGADAESVLMTAVSKHASNPRINVQLVDWNFYGDEDRRTQDEDSREVEKKQADSRISTLSKSSSRLPVGDEDSREVEKKQADSRISTSESSSRLPVGAGRKPPGMVESDPSKKDGSDDSSTTAGDLRFKLLEKITGGFSKEHEIGSGGFGKVYKGVLNGKEIAVKKLHSHLALDDVIFKNECENLMRVHHQNIVELVGYCHEIQHRCVEHNGRTVYAEMVDRALCFEYLQNGSLDKHLYEEHCGLDWCTRYKIIKGICEGLNYLHGLEKYILHLDLKPANILLDENMVPKIADFELSRLFGGTHTHITKNPVGTQMYMPPEYVNEGIITKKYDVFSLGVIIIQIMTGRVGLSKYWEMSSQNFIQLVHQNWKLRVEATSMHTSAGEDCKQVERCIKIALNCVKAEREERPTIRDIIHKLRETESMTHEVPMPFSQESGSAGSSHFKTEMAALSVNDHSSMRPSDLSLLFLKDITNGFSEGQKLGSGGYGEVYKGVDKNGKEFAVKKLHPMPGLDDVQFKNEFNSLMRVQHKNIVRLVGYCYEVRHTHVEHNGEFVFCKIIDRVLCLEYLQGGSLDKHLDEESSGHDWRTRYKIIKGICEGLNYLHVGLPKPMFHLDLKPGNILLDKNMVPKIADIGLSRLFGGTQTHTTKNCIGTQLYMPPEYISKQQISNKYDVFSLGVIILQIMTGLEGYSKCVEMSPQQFIELVHKNWRDRIEQETSKYAAEDCQQVKRCIEIAINCVEVERDKRPTIKDIIRQLKQTETNGSASSWEQAGLAKIGQWGGVGGGYNDIEVAPCRLKSLRIGSGEVIYSLEFSYYDKYGNEHTAGPWGGLGPERHGSDRGMIELGSSEFLTEVHGTIGPFDRAPAGAIKSLTFITNAGSYGPFGEVKGTPFQIPVRSNGSIVGFFARAGWYVDAFGIYVNPKQETEAGLAKMGPWGGNGGKAHDVKVAPRLLKSVTICSGIVVDSIAFSYSDHNGKQHTGGPWGGPGGSADTIQLGAREFLTGVYGTTGPCAHSSSDVVTSLTLVTNERSYGRFGEGGGIPFQIPTWSNGSIVGFFGRAESYVDAIGVYANPEQEAMGQEAGLTKIGPWGGNGGNPRDIDIHVEPYRLESVTISCAAVINSLAFSYIDLNGRKHTVGPWGSPGGNTYTIQLKPLEFLQGVSVTVGPFGVLPNVITSIMFNTNHGCYGPFGQGGGTMFSAPAERDGCIVGFFGRAGSCVEALGVYIHRY